MAYELQRAIPVDDYKILVDVMDRFCVDDHIPACPDAWEYTVHITRDPERDLYRELVDMGRCDQRLMPLFNRRYELGGGGPDANSQRAREIAQAIHDRKQRPVRDPTIDPANQHHLARPTPPNARDLCRRPPPPREVAIDHEDEEVAGEMQDRWEPDEDQPRVPYHRLHLQN